LAAAVQPAGAIGLALVSAGLLASWWIYVPVHELLHAAGCLAAGGEVTRLEIEAMYGAAFLQRFVPFVVVGSSYAGQLTGFETHGNDLIYLATDAAPYGLTVLVGVPLMQAVATASWRPAWRAVWFGVAAPVALAPFLSLGGDYYEIGSILVSRAARLIDSTVDSIRWRSDDLVKLALQDLPAKGGLRVVDVAGLVAGLVVGVTLAVATYRLGSAWAAWLRRNSRGRRTSATPPKPQGQLRSPSSS
jgi:hypothetical protein